MDSIGKHIDSITSRANFSKKIGEVTNKIINYPEVREFIEENKNSISSDMIERSLANLNEYMLEMEAKKRGEEGQNPGFRPQLSINGPYIEISYEPTQKYFAHVQARQQEKLLDNRMMSLDVRNATLGSLDIDNESRNNLLTQIVQFGQAYKVDPRSAQGLYIYGGYGVGKTYMLGALANDIVETGASIIMLHYPTFIAEVKQLISTKEGYLPEINRVKSPDILMLDDIGAERNTSWTRDEVLNLILEHRMKESLPTFFTSNFSMSELESHLASTPEADSSVKAKRVMERIKFLAKEIQLEGPNRRQHGSQF